MAWFDEPSKEWRVLDIFAATLVMTGAGILTLWSAQRTRRRADRQDLVDQLVDSCSEGMKDIKGRLTAHVGSENAWKLYDDEAKGNAVRLVGEFFRVEPEKPAEMVNADALGPEPIWGALWQVAAHALWVTLVATGFCRTAMEWPALLQALAVAVGGAGIVKWACAKARSEMVRTQETNPWTLGCLWVLPPAYFGLVLWFSASVLTTIQGKPTAQTVVNTELREES